MIDEDELTGDLESLATKTVAILAAEIVKGGGRALINWIKRRGSRRTAEAVDALAPHPDADGGKKALERSLQKDLEEWPELVEELREVVAHHRTGYASQHANASSGSTIIQIQGNDNRVGE